MMVAEEIDVRRLGFVVEECGTHTLLSLVYNPIEEAFAKVKAILQRTAARTRESLIKAIG
jgi:hypothetical protein